VRTSANRCRRAAGLAAVASLLAAAGARAQELPPPVVPPPPGLSITGPALRATGVAIPLTGRGAPAGAVVEFQRLLGGRRWLTIKTVVAGSDGTAQLGYKPLNPSPTGRYRMRIAVGGVASPALTVRTRDITLAAPATSTSATASRR
jgi:hypothetical protein